MRLRGRLGERVLRFGELHVRFGPGHGGARILEPEIGGFPLDADEHRALGDILPDVDRRGGDPARAFRGDIRGLVRIETAGGFDDDRLVDPVDRRNPHGRRGAVLGGRRGAFRAATGRREQSDAR